MKFIKLIKKNFQKLSFDNDFKKVNCIKRISLNYE